MDENELLGNVEPPREGGKFWTPEEGTHIVRFTSGARAPEVSQYAKLEADMVTLNEDGTVIEEWLFAPSSKRLAHAVATAGAKAGGLLGLTLRVAVRGEPGDYEREFVVEPMQLTNAQTKVLADDGGD